MTQVFRLLQKVAYLELYKNKDDIIKNVMDGIRFNEEDNFHIKSRKIFGEPTTPSMIRFLLRYGIVRNERQALVVLLSFVALVIALTIYLSNGLLTSGGQGYVQDKFGNKYTPEQYFKLRQEGKDPLFQNFIK